MTNVGIYKITSPSNKIYIGQSWQLEERKNQYKRKGGKSQRKLYNSIMYYGWENHKHEIVHYLPTDISQEVLDNHEILYWECYKDCGYEMMNIIAPGRGGKKGEVFSQLMKDAHARRSPEKKKEIYKKVSEAHKGKKLSKEHKEKGAKSREVPIVMMDLDGNFIQEFESASKASLFLGVTPSTHISMVLKGKLNSCKGYTFVRKKEYDINKDYSVPNFKRKVFQYDLEGNYITEFNSITEASNKLNISDTCISETINNITILCCGGFQWKDFKVDKIDKRILFKDKRKVYQYSKSGEFVKEWGSASEASEELKISRGCIVSNCNGTYERMKTYKGFVWSYEFKPYIKRIKCSYQKSILQYDLNMNFIKEWDTMKDICDALGISHVSISQNCRGRNKTAKGFIWKYKEENI